MSGDRAVILLSGGLDSTTCLGLALQQGYDCYPLTFSYNQRHTKELLHAKHIANFYSLGDRHRIVHLDFFKEFVQSSLLGKKLPRLTGVTEGVPSTYVPARNLVFLSVAAAYAESFQARFLFIGASAVDYSGYPDCRPEFIRSFTQTARLATVKGELEVQTPLVNLSKAETIRLGLSLKVPYHLTTSCYLGQEQACGLCDSCRLRLKGFREAGVEDPIEYQGSARGS